MAYRMDISESNNGVEDSKTLSLVSNFTAPDACDTSKTFISAVDYSSMEEYHSLQQSKLDLSSNKYRLLQDVTYYVESKTKRTAKSLDSLNVLDKLPFMPCEHSTPGKHLRSKKTAFEGFKQDVNGLSPIKSRSLETDMNISYPHSMSDLGLFPMTRKYCSKKNNSATMKSGTYQYIDTFKILMARLKKPRLSAAEAKLVTVIDEMEKAINKSTEDCSKPLASQVLKHISDSKKQQRSQNEKKDCLTKYEISAGKEADKIEEQAISSNDLKCYEAQVLADIESLRDVDIDNPRRNVMTEVQPYVCSTGVPTLENECGIIEQDCTSSEQSYNTTFDSCLSTRKLVNESIRYSYLSYEEMSALETNCNTKEGQKHIIKHIYINEQIIQQTIKMLKYGHKNDSQFLGSLIHLEGERILLVAKTRRDALHNMYTIPKPANDTSSTVILKGLSVRLNNLQEQICKDHVDQYFMCVLQHKATVYSTVIKIANTKRSIYFGGHFIFENVTNASSVEVSLYSMSVKTVSSKCMGISRFRRYLQVPMMSLIGAARIDLLNANETRVFTLITEGNVVRPEYSIMAYTEVI